MEKKLEEAALVVSVAGALMFLAVARFIVWMAGAHMAPSVYWFAAGIAVGGSFAPLVMREAEKYVKNKEGRG